MGEHSCIHENDIGRIAGSIERIEKELFGNGQKELSQTVPVLINNVEKLEKTTEALRTAMSGINRFVNETQGSRKTWKDMTPWVAVIIAAIALTVGMVNDNKTNKNQGYLQYQMQFKQDKELDTTTRSALEAAEPNKEKKK